MHIDMARLRAACSAAYVRYYAAQTQRIVAWGRENELSRAFFERQDDVDARAAWLAHRPILEAAEAEFKHTEDEWRRIARQEEAILAVVREQAQG